MPIYTPRGRHLPSPDWCWTFRQSEPAGDACRGGGSGRPSWLSLSDSSVPGAAPGHFRRDGVPAEWICCGNGGAADVIFRLRPHSAAPLGTGDPPHLLLSMPRPWRRPGRGRPAIPLARGEGWLCSG